MDLTLEALVQAPRNPLHFAPWDLLVSQAIREGVSQAEQVSSRLIFEHLSNKYDLIQFFVGLMDLHCVSDKAGQIASWLSVHFAAVRGHT